MIYTTLNNLTRKLKGRLKIVSVDNSPLFPVDNPGQIVDNETIYTIVEEKEEFINLILDQIYILPLVNSHKIIQNITDNLVISDLLAIHYQGGGFGGLSPDLSGQGNALKIEALNMLGMLTVGLNIYIPGIQLPQSYPGTPQVRRIELPGETLRSISPQRILINSDVIVERSDREYDYFTKDDDYKDNPFNENWNYFENKK